MLDILCDHLVRRGIFAGLGFMYLLALVLLYKFSRPITGSDGNLRYVVDAGVCAVLLTAMLLAATLTSVALVERNQFCSEGCAS